ncbi:bromodomain adjacent to zinc finger domain protein 2B-like isoform X13 [Aricia agestis]|uniref:bromodomain adjacent to zinc finger domain protein 2B-like isoform X13 n=1 Tax=Aricia agestis TaxID=91739 RepID=UPI001C2073AE|nr:bromodomain adjacent to zinc finger domain protein 2B-like isoform X13 [Aricia agestis]
MDKENGDGGGEAAKPPPDSMLDPSGLFGAYWGRDGGGGGAAAQAQAQAQAALFGFGSRYPPPTTLGVAANQAASLGLHPAASAAWWSMASHLAAQDYLARLQASGLNFPPMADPYAALSALSAMKQPQKPAKPPSRNDRSGRSSSSSVSAKDKSPATSTASSQPSMRSSYGFPKTSSPSTMSSPSLSSLASLNNLAQQPLHSKPSKQQPLPSRKSSSSSSSSSKEKERDLAMLRGDLMLAQAAAHGAYHAAVAAAKGKNMSPLYPFSMSGSEKDRRSGIDSLTGLPHNILSAALESGDPSSVLGGVRLPPDTEIIKYTSSLAGPKVPPGTTNRGRKKTISLDPPQVSVHPSSERAAPLPSKRQKVDEYGNSRSSVEVIRLPTKPERANSVSGTPPPNLADYAGISRELLQTIASQSGVSLAALERQLAGTTAADSGLNLSTKSNNTSAEESPLDLGTKGDDDAPLNLSLKPTPPSTQASDALSRLTSLSSSLNASNDRISRRKPGAKPRRVAPEGGGAPAHSPRPTSSGSEDSEAVSSWGAREGRPRNLGRGVSKPKKNTVASLLAQSRALGLRPALAQQLLGETDLEKLRALVGEGGSTDSCASDSAASDSETGEPDPPLRLPLALGWRRVTLVRGLSRKCHVRGDVSYSPPEPHAALHIKSPAELQTFLEANPCPPLCRDNFSFSSRTILGEYIQPATDGAEPSVLTEAEITKRVEEARAACGRPTPPPLERRMELARRQQAQRDARAQQARLVRELERTEKAEYVKREKEARSQQLLEAKKKKQEEAEKQKMEDQAKRQQERELKRHQAMLLKEQQKFISEERERRRQHTTFIRQLDGRRRWEERERRKHQNLLDRLLVKEKKLQQRRKEMELLSELRRPQEDSTLSDHKPLPELERLPARIAGQAMADLLHVFEFLHNFGQALGFDVESLPNLDTLQQGLIPNYSQEAEDQLITVMTRLLIIAIEDPGIPHPGRHTTLLGHAIRMGDVTPANLSEVLRIYLYANATGEVKALTGLTVERERERRVADHHQSDAEMTHANVTTKNPAYYDHLHNNATYKLSETLRDKPFVALNPTTKARMMARICDELTQSRAVLRQLDAALDQLAQLRRERFTLDTRIRKVRSLHQRKLRTEQTEKQQAMALERMQRLVEESSVTRTSPDDDRSDKSETPKKRDKESSPDNENSKQNTPSPYKEPPTDESDKELSPLKDLSNSIKSKEMLNNNKDECSPNDPKIDKDSVMGDCDANLSDLESEGTQPEEDEDKNLSSEELSRKLDKLMRQSEQQLQALAAASHALRATCFGQDRYWRRYWSLGKCGGVYVEAMESAQPEIMDYHAKLEADALWQNRADVDDMKKGVSEWSDSAMRAEELRSIKTELNLSDRTQIIKYEPNLERQSDAQGSRYMCGIKMEEKYIQEKSHEEEDMLDIEDSIPTAFLVQKPTHKPMFAPQPEPAEKSPEVKPEPVKTETVEKEEPEESKDNLVNNLEELRKMAEAVSSQLDAAKKAEIEKTEVKEEIKDETVSPEEAHSILYTKITEGKWFSILRHERFLTSINEEQPPEPEYRDNEHTCAEIITTQGHRWDVSNNLHLLNDPSLFTLNSMVTSVQVPSNNVYADSSLTMSGLDQEMMDASLSAAPQPPAEKEQENDLEKELQADAAKDLATQKSKASGLTSLGMLNFNALSTYVTCDSPPPIQMTPEEQEQLEHCKVHGLPKKLDTQYVPKDLRHGWWRITDPDQMQEVMRALHPRGVRERELHAALAHHLLSFNNKIHIEKGIAVAQLEGPAGETPEPDAPGSFCTAAARRVDMQLLAAVEALEERVAAGSMQVKGWRPARQTRDSPPPAATGALIVARARDQLAALEAHIERRYLKPPLVHSTADANIGAVLQAEHGNAPATSPHSDTTTENKPEGRGVARGLATWREGVSRCNTSAQLAMMLAALDSAVAWDKSIMKANCQFCQSGDNEAELLLCDGCDKGYHTYCFKPRMEKIPEGDWYCWECVNKARGQRVCIVCGGGAGGAGRLIPCALCSRAYHHDCHYPPLPKNPRGKWYCSQCISRAPPKKPRKASKRDSKSKDTSLDLDSSMVPSPAASHASTSTTAEEAPAAVPVAEPDPAPEQPTPEPAPDPENGLNHTSLQELSDEPPEKRRATHFVAGNGALQHDDTDGRVDGHVPDPEVENIPLLSRAKKDKGCTKKMSKEMQFCKNLLCEMECHEHAWPFLVPVNTKQFPQYRKVIKCPMDLSTIKRKLQDSVYKCKEEFASDVRLIFSNCEVFNEDDSPVGRAGHSMRQFFETRWP